MDEQKHRDEDNDSHLATIDKLTLLISEHTSTILNLQKDFSSLIYSHNKDLKHLKEQNALAAKQNGFLADDIAAFRRQISDLTASLSQLEKEKAHMTEQQALGVEENQRLKAVIATLRVQGSQLEDTIARLETRIAEEIQRSSECQAHSLLQVNGLNDENVALRMQVSDLEGKAAQLTEKLADTIARFETRIAEETQRASERQAHSVFQINGLKDENAALRMQVSDSEGKAAQLAEKMAVDSAARSALMCDLDDLRGKMESVTISAMKEKETFQAEADTLRSTISDQVALEGELQQKLSETLLNKVLYYNYTMPYYGCFFSQVHSVSLLYSKS